MACDPNPFAYGRQRLAVNSREFRYVPGVGVFAIAWIARAINIGIINGEVRSCTRDQIVGMIASVIPFDDAGEQHRFASLALRKPLLAYADPNGGLRLLDGRKRARQAFAEGQAEVLVTLVSFNDAQRYGMPGDVRKRWEVAEATKHHPITTLPPVEDQPRWSFEAALAQLSSVFLKRGRPNHTKLQERLDAYMYYFFNALIDLEDFIRRHHVKHCLMDKSRKYSGKEVWAPKFFEYFVGEHDLVFQLAFADIKNSAKRVIEKVSIHNSRSSYKQSSDSLWRLMSVEQLKNEREQTVRICKAVTKAAFRLKIWQDSQHELVSKEYKNRSIHHKDVENDVYHSIRKPMVRDKSVEFRKSILGIEDQIIVTNVPGVNMNEVYFDALCIDPLLEAYVFYHSVQKRGRTEVDLGMIETVVQRRDMMIAGETDQLSESWDAVLELWAQAGITDSVILRMSEWCDRGMLISERMAIDFRFEEPRTPL